MHTVIPAPPQRVWEDLSQIGRHVEWMDDARAIRFHSPQRSGVGTSFETDTKVGPFQLTDQMVITRWEPAHAIGVDHRGVVTGTGCFTLEAVPGREGGEEHTRFGWEERLRFPLWMGGWLAGQAGRPLLVRIWQRNLGNLRRRFE